ncbi:MAG: hypothetical protein JO042_05375 [Sinobacteraceae bacterium]|nr:hypothetical protein [Nevskiaceae bacterium]
MSTRHTRDASFRVLASAELTGPEPTSAILCKQAAIALLMQLSEEHAPSKAVNTVRLTDGRRIGFNTEARGSAAGFQRDLSGCSPLHRSVQIGAGGAGAATAYALLKSASQFDAASVPYRE